MRFNRRVVLALALAAVTAVTVLILRGLLGTIFFAITVAYVLVPLTAWQERRGLPRWWAAAGSTVAAFVFGLVVFVPIAAILYVRRRSALAFIRSLPDSVTLSVGEFTYLIDGSDVTAFVASRLTAVAVAIASEMPVLAAKLVVFGFIVFALLFEGDRLHRALLAPVPVEYHDVARALHVRVRETLFSLYVIQAATSIGTFAIALVVFLALGTPFPVTLAVLAGVLQFLPVVGPSVVIVGLAISDMVAGDIVGGATVLVVGLVFVGVLPDAVLRPRLSKHTRLLPASLYFVGFTGGLLSLGPVGIVAGPLVLVVLLELLSMLAHGGHPRTERIRVEPTGNDYRD